MPPRTRRPHTSSGTTSSFGRPQPPPPLYSSSSSSFLDHLPAALHARRAAHTSHVRTGSVPSHDVPQAQLVQPTTFSDLVAQTAELQLVTPRAPALTAARCPPSSGRPVRRPHSRGGPGDITPTTPSRARTADPSEDESRYYGRKVLATTLASHTVTVFPPSSPSSFVPLPPGVPSLPEFAAYLLHRTQPPRTFCSLALHILSMLARSPSPPNLSLPSICMTHCLRPHALLLAAHILATFELMDDAYSSKSFNIASGRIMTLTSSRWGHTPGERPQEDSRAVRKIDALVMECLRSLDWTVRAASEDVRRGVRAWEAEIDRREEEARWPVHPQPPRRPSPASRTPSDRTDRSGGGSSGHCHSDATPELSPDMSVFGKAEDDSDDGSPYGTYGYPGPPIAWKTMVDLPVAMAAAAAAANTATIPAPAPAPAPVKEPPSPATGGRKRSVRQSWSMGGGLGRLRARVEGVLA